MILVLSYACPACSMGWTTQHRQSLRCSRCGKPGEVRGSYWVADIKATEP
jgi:hypothetical protein